jgi:hypothetical protein
MIGRVDSCYLTRALFASAMATTLNGRRDGAAATQKTSTPDRGEPAF